ncbi:hypothetical protein BT96DRAFT_941446 [Gymnopus androsaceus JB14]|uniref:Uncharacterized protein n=1 Tax=Gymnopus androsaceus JB14 TaxID=1447944 RepID=A0A6A4HGD9_9AGAR|nr:hypothetical protein BT96DRAFT_941446 [Gymnopus androsaceus JB14]
MPSTPTTVAPQDTTTQRQYVPQYAPSYEYRHYQAPSASTSTAPASTVAPRATTSTPTPAPAPVAAPAPAPSTTPVPSTSTAVPAALSASHNGPNGPLVATGDWTRDLVHLAKTAELKKHALTLQLHTAHILSAHASLEQKGKSIQDVKEQRNKLESERVRLLNSLRQVNEDRDKADLLAGDLERECSNLRTQILSLSEGDYASAKADVDRLRAELGHPPLPSLQSMLDEKAAGYLNERRLNGNSNPTSGPSAAAAPVSTRSTPVSAPTTTATTKYRHYPSSASYPTSQPQPVASGSGSSSSAQPAASNSNNYTNSNANMNINPNLNIMTMNTNNKRTLDSVDSGTAVDGLGVAPTSAKRPRGRPKGSKNTKRSG